MLFACDLLIGIFIQIGSYASEIDDVVVMIDRFLEKLDGVLFADCPCKAIKLLIYKYFLHQIFSHPESWDRRDDDREIDNPLHFVSLGYVRVLFFGEMKYPCYEKGSTSDIDGIDKDEIERFESDDDVTLHQPVSSHTQWWHQRSSNRYTWYYRQRFLFSTERDSSDQSSSDSDTDIPDCRRSPCDDFTGSSLDRTYPKIYP